MGWLFQDISRKHLVDERTQSWEQTLPDDVVVRSTCLRHCYRGNVHSGVLWSVWERTWTKDGRQVRPADRWIMCDLLRYQGGQWGYKDMEESCGPFYWSCPLSYLDMVPVANEEWRRGVRNYHERQRAKRQAKKRN